jgi:hypothetical protein
LSDGPHQVDLARTDVPQAELAKSLQSELSRVGCFTGAVDGEWNAASQRSLELFNRQARTKFDTKLASLDALDAIKLRSSRICPMICDHGYRADGDQCSKITCAEGSFLNDDNECEKQRAAKPAKPATAKPATAKRDDGDERPARQRRQAGGEAAGAAGGFGGAAGIAAAAGASRRSSGGQLFCNNSGCRAVNRGCHLEYRGGGGPGNDANAEVCN